MMRYLKITAIFFSILNFAEAQNKYWQLPHDYNSFVNNSNISWAIETWMHHSFVKNELIDIHSYLVSAQRSGKIKSYVTIDYDESVVKPWKRKTMGDFYLEIDKAFNLLVPDSLKDSTNSMLFHEIYYLENHKLKTQIISGGAEYPVITSNGIFLGNGVAAYSSLHFYNSKLKDHADKIYFLGQTNTFLNIDSAEATCSLKKSFGMNLCLNLWNDLADGYNQVIDLKNITIIPRKIILNYSPFDSTEVEPGDTILPYKIMQPGAAGYLYFSNIEIIEKWYYNKTKDAFYSTIDNAYLYIKYPDSLTNVYRTDKRFKIIF
jgi:hypothetical protein